MNEDAQIRMNLIMGLMNLQIKNPAMIIYELFKKYGETIEGIPGFMGLIQEDIGPVDSVNISEEIYDNMFLVSFCKIIQKFYPDADIISEAKFLDTAIELGLI